MDFLSNNFYQRLGVSSIATPDEVRRAFRGLARIHHPDVASNKTHAEEMFKRLNEAYEILSDATKRSQYDRQMSRSHNFGTPRPRSHTPTPRPTRPTYTSQFPKPPPKARRPAEPAARVHRPDLDIEAELEITFEDAVQGATYVVTIQQQDHSARRQNLHSCRVHVPAGVYDGQRLRLKNLGYIDSHSLDTGDLFLSLRFARHKKFRIVGANLCGDLVISPWEAALGTRARVPTLHGLADLHIPPGAQPGQRLRLPRYGLPQKDGATGDFLITLQLRVPLATSEKERELWRALAFQHGGSRR